MKKGFFIFVAIATLMMFLSAGSVFAAENGNTGVYIGMSGGYVIPHTMALSDPDESGNSFDATLKNGYLAGVTVGWLTPFTKRILAMEVEYNYIFGTDFDKDKIIPDIAGGGPGTLDATIRLHALLFNFKARYPEGRFHPYAGFGIGWSYFQLGNVTTTAGGGFSAPGVSGNAFCWQLLAGLDFDITPNLGVGIGYKYFVTKPTLGSESDDFHADADYRTSIVTVGLTYTF